MIRAPSSRSEKQWQVIGGKWRGTSGEGQVAREKPNEKRTKTQERLEWLVPSEKAGTNEGINDARE